MRRLAIIPARKGSKRFPGKNMVLLGGKPLLQIAIEEAKKANVFDDIIVTTDWEACGELAAKMGVWYVDRPKPFCGDESHDYQFVRHAISQSPCDVFAILRPTSPFRTAATIQRAMGQFFIENEIEMDRETLPGKLDSMRAVEIASQHPLKMWAVHHRRMMNYIYPTQLLGEKEREKIRAVGFPACDLGTQQLGTVYAQNGCIHIAWAEVLNTHKNVSGQIIAPFFTQFPEGLDINTREDLIYATAIQNAARNGDGAV